LKDRPLSILVVEDYESDFEMLAARLASSSVEAWLERVEDEPAMRQALAARRTDIVICDYKLPRFSLAAALRVLREHDPDIPLIVVSGMVGEEAAVDALRAGAEDFVLKDRMARLPGAIERSIAAAETRRRQRRAEAALRDSEALLRSLAANLPAMVFRLRYERGGGSLGLGYAGEGSSRIFGLSPQALRQDPSLLFLALAPEERAGLHEHMARAAEAETGLSWQGRTAAPQERWIQVQATLRERDARSVQWDGIAIDITDLKRAEAEVRDLTAHLERVKESERAGVAREIHDDIGALFFGLKVDLAWLRKRLEGQPAMLERLDSIDAHIDSGVQASQRIVRLLHPPVLDYGVVGAAEWLTRDFQQRTGIPCAFASNVEELSLPQELGTAIFRVLQESLTNILRHAGASKVAVSLNATRDAVELEVLDDGRGVAPEDLGKRTSYGVRGMRERVRELGGEFELGAGPQGGTRLALSLPQPGQKGEKAA
jgi:signal transduction histidine kinase/FixJ family two-component response regulator